MQPVALSASANSISGRSGGHSLSLITSFLHGGGTPPSFLSGRLDSGHGRLSLRIPLSGIRGFGPGQLCIPSPPLRGPGRAAQDKAADKRRHRVAAPARQHARNMHQRAHTFPRHPRGS
ncbi:hypothetical protein L576_2406 [Bordetella bronchiseptica OSU054]|nr:hypothetical protein L576_2406 [Bordetella bronchiseptica OSU054]